MKIAAFALLLASVAVCAQNATSASSSQDRFRKQVLQNDHVTVYLVEIPPQQATAMHRHDHDTLSIFINGGSTQAVAEDGSSVRNRFEPGDVRFRPAPYAHSVKNTGKDVLRVVDIESAIPVSGEDKRMRKKAHYCNPGSKTACITEDFLFCKPRFCVDDVTMGPGAKVAKHTHDTDHMVIAITDFSMDDDTEGKGVIKRNVKSGEVEFFPAGLSHSLTNTTNKEIRFITILLQ